MAESPIETEAELLRRIGAQMTREYQTDPEQTRDHDIRTVTRASESLFDYHNSIAKLEHESRMASVLYPGDAQMQYEHIRTFDARRQNAHNDAIDGIAKLNALCADYGLDPMFEGNPHETSMRHAVTTFSENYVRACHEDAVAHRQEQMGHAYEGDQQLEDTRYQRDLEVRRSMNVATGTLTKGREAEYWPEYAQKRAAEDPNWVENDARASADRAAQKRASRRLPHVSTTKTNDDRQFGA